MDMEKSTEQQHNLIDLIEADLHVKEDLNCAETILYGVDRAYELELPPSALRLAAGFGGGMGVESTCGVVTGGVMALSALFVQGRSHEDEFTGELIREYVNGFLRLYGTLECSIIKEQNRKPDGDCKPIILEGAKLLHTIIERERRMRA
jgi:C_GCAxxG_C_C family probable redox protein